MVRSLMSMAGDSFTPENVKSGGQGAATVVWPRPRRRCARTAVPFSLTANSARRVPRRRPRYAKRLWEMSERWARTRFGPSATSAIGRGRPATVPVMFGADAGKIQRTVMGKFFSILAASDAVFSECSAP